MFFSFGSRVGFVSHTSFTEVLRSRLTMNLAHLANSSISTSISANAPNTLGGINPCDRNSK